MIDMGSRWAEEITTGFSLFLCGKQTTFVMMNPEQCSLSCHNNFWLTYTDHPVQVSKSDCVLILADIAIPVNIGQRPEGLGGGKRQGIFFLSCWGSRWGLPQKFSGFYKHFLASSKRFITVILVISHSAEMIWGPKVIKTAVDRITPPPTAIYSLMLFHHYGENRSSHQSEPAPVFAHEVDSLSSVCHAVTIHCK